MLGVNDGFLPLAREYRPCRRPDPANYTQNKTTAPQAEYGVESLALGTVPPYQVNHRQPPSSTPHTHLVLPGECHSNPAKTCPIVGHFLFLTEKRCDR